jgi:Homeodomain-like domain
MKRLREKHRIAIYRILAGHPYDRVARMVGVHWVTVSRWMRDRVFLQAFLEKKKWLERQIEVEHRGMNAVVGDVFRELLLFGSEGTRLQCILLWFETYKPEPKKVEVTVSKKEESIRKSVTWWKLLRS